MRTHKIDFKEFTSGRYKEKRNKNKKVYMAVMAATGGYLLIGLPKGAWAATQLANGGDPFENLYNAAMRLFDGAVVVMVVICSAMWGLSGNRSAAIEKLIGIGAAYILARHAKDIRDFLKTI
jgi:hypothetical protein